MMVTDRHSVCWRGRQWCRGQSEAQFPVSRLSAEAHADSSTADHRILLLLEYQCFVERDEGIQARKRGEEEREKDKRRKREKRAKGENEERRDKRNQK